MLSARARWMVSGTPLFSGLDDLNGELNFLGVIPFSCPDATDGFWASCVSAPFERREPVALDRLHALLSKLMMRHSKAQRYAAAPSRSLLALPPASVETVAVERGPARGEEAAEERGRPLLGRPSRRARGAAAAAAAGRGRRGAETAAAAHGGAGGPRAGGADARQDRRHVYGRDARG